ncbi:MAG: hypothetical protein ACO32Y_08995, partial [Vulcanococcus sp.]
MLHFHNNEGLSWVLSHWFRNSARELLCRSRRYPLCDGSHAASRSQALVALVKPLHEAPLPPVKTGVDWAPG